MCLIFLVYILLYKWQPCNIVTAHHIVLQGLDGIIVQCWGLNIVAWSWYHEAWHSERTLFNDKNKYSYMHCLLSVLYIFFCYCGKISVIRSIKLVVPNIDPDEYFHHCLMIWIKTTKLVFYTCNKKKILISQLFVNVLLSRISLYGMKYARSDLICW